MDESTGRSNVDQSTTDPPKSEQPNADQSKSDQSNTDQSNADQPKSEQPDANQPKADQSILKESSLRASNPDHSGQDHTRIDQLLAVNRELALYLEEQLDAVLALRQSVAAIENALQGNAAMRKRYEKCLQSVKDGEESLPEIHRMNRIRGVFSRLQRSGTL